MLFADPAVAGLMNQQFECAWEMVRAVPKITIDFGEGRVLERTLMGNVATYVTLADGRVLDVLPGLLTRAEYRRRLERDRELFTLATRVEQEAGEEGLTSFLRQHHELEAAALAPVPAGGANLDAGSFPTAFLLDDRKALVEDPIKDALRALHLFGSAVPAVDPADPLAADTEHNRTFRDPLVQRLLATGPLATPAELTATVYRDVLHVDLADPWLGLAPYVLGGEPGRHDGAPH